MYNQLEKNLISVRKFYKDNEVSIELFPNHFIVKNLVTRNNVLTSSVDYDRYKACNLQDTVQAPKDGSNLVSCHHIKISASSLHERFGHPHSTST